MVPVARGLRETHGTLEIAAVRNVDYGQAWLVVAGGGTVASLPMGWRHLLAIRKDQLVPLFQPPVQIRIGEDQGIGGFVA